MTRKAIAIALLAIASIASLAAFANRGNGGAVRGAAARAGMMGGRFTEVQYLQSTGTQYIDTGYAFASERVTIDTAFLAAANTTQNVIGSPKLYTRSGYYWAVPNQVEILVNGTVTKQYWGAGTAGAKTPLAFTANNGALSAWSGSSSYTASYSGSIVGGGNCMLFAYSASTKSAVAIYYAQITDNGILVRDFVPVRDTAGNGYMLDKVTGQLFGNAGTGAFIVGPDK